jgi:hypothetical protein
VCAERKSLEGIRRRQSGWLRTEMVGEEMLEAVVDAG